MNKEEISDKETDFLRDNDIDLIPKTLRLNQRHFDFLKKIDSRNDSNAVRIVIDNFMKQKTRMMFEKYLTSFGFGIVLLCVGLLMANVYVSLTAIFTGLLMIGYSLYMYLKGRSKYKEQ